MPLQHAARVALHQFGGLRLLRAGRRRQYRVLMFHQFHAADEANLAALCEHITRHYEPVSLTRVAAALQGGPALPDNALTLTIDDGYRSVLLHGHPILRRYHVPTTIYAVSGFTDGRLWLWIDQIAFGLEETAKRHLRVDIAGRPPLELDLSSLEARAHAAPRLTGLLKELPDQQRRRFMEDFGKLCGVEIPRTPPPASAPLSWDELRLLQAEGVEIGCHTDTHPILSRVSDPTELDREVSGAKAILEGQLGSRVTHFCYPNGRAMDIGETALEAVRRAGYQSSTTCTFALGDPGADPLFIPRVPFDSKTPVEYGKELLAGLHL